MSGHKISGSSNCAVATSNDAVVRHIQTEPEQRDGASSHSKDKVTVQAVSGESIIALTPQTKHAQPQDQTQCQWRSFQETGLRSLKLNTQRSKLPP